MARDTILDNVAGGGYGIISFRWIENFLLIRSLKTTTDGRIIPPWRDLQHEASFGTSGFIS